MHASVPQFARLGLSTTTSILPLKARAGVVYRLEERTRLRISAGTGFKEPTFFENFAHGFVQRNPNLDPERSRSWEAGFEHRRRCTSLAVTYFDQRFRDLIEYDAAPPPNQPDRKSVV